MQISQKECPQLAVTHDIKSFKQIEQLNILLSNFKS